VRTPRQQKTEITKRNTEMASLGKVWRYTGESSGAAVAALGSPRRPARASTARAEREPGPGRARAARRFQRPPPQPHPLDADGSGGTGHCPIMLWRSEVGQMGDTPERKWATRPPAPPTCALPLRRPLWAKTTKACIDTLQLTAPCAWTRSAARWTSDGV